MLVILTRPPQLFSLETAKAAIKKILNKKRGPEGVLQSLKRGLNEINFSFELNKKPQDGDDVHVLSSVKALKYAINLKKQGKIRHLIAGPNLVVIPDEQDRILASPEIDKILMVSEWTKKFYAETLPEASQKIEVYPSGVEIPFINPIQKRSGAIIFKKVVDNDIFHAVEEELKKRQIPYFVFVYGKFSQAEYFSALETTKFMIYLQEVESQGIALQEAWARNVPTLVWNRGTFTYPTGQTVNGNIAAPYLTDQCGMFFKDINELPYQLDRFTANLPFFSAREYCENNLSDKATAETYVKILESIK